MCKEFIIFFYEWGGNDWSKLSEWVFFIVCVKKNTTVLVVNNTVEKIRASVTKRKSHREIFFSEGMTLFVMNKTALYIIHILLWLFN